MDITLRKTIPKSTAEQIIEQIQYHGSLRAYDLHKFLRISRVAVHKQLRKLLATGELKKIGKPPLVEYVLSNNTMNHDLRLKKIKDMVLPILKEAGVTRSAVFGSTARGDNRIDSDIDLLVDFPKEKSLFDFVDLKLKLEDVLHKKVDLVEYGTIKPRIRHQILNEQVLL